MISYTYKIQKVDATSKVMEIEYSADGYATLLIGARLPLLSETLEQVVQSYAPIGTWVQEKAEVQVPAEGRVGTISSSPEVASANSLEEAKQAKVWDLVKWRQSADMVGITASGAHFATGQQVQQSLITSLVAMQSNLIPSAYVIASDGRYVNLTLPQLTTAATAVMQRARVLSEQEQILRDQIINATSVEQVQSVAIPFLTI